MSARATPLGSGLYFIDVLACLLFCLTLALASARFGKETSVDVDLPELDAAAGAGSALAHQEIALRGAGADLEVFLDGEALDLAELEARLRAAPPAAVVVRSEESVLGRVVAAAHGAGVREIEIAYEARRAGED